METLTIEELQKNFDEYFSRVESGEAFLIKSEFGNVMLLPYKSGENEIDDLIRIHIDHEEGS